MNTERRYAKRLLNRWLVGPLAVALTLGVGVRWWDGNQDPGVDPPAPVMLTDNAFDTLQKAGLSLSKAEKDAIGRVASGKPQPTDPDAKTLLDRNRAALSQVRSALDRTCRMPAMRSFNALCPYFADFRTLARLFQIEGQTYLKAGDRASAARSYGDMLRLGGQVSHGSILIGYLVSMAISEIARQGLWSVLDAAKASGDTATMATVTAELERSAKANATLREVLTEEKYAMQGGVLEIFRHPEHLRDSEQNTWHPATFMPMYLIWPKREVYANISGYMDELIRRNREPYGTRFDANIPEPKDFISQIILPVFAQATFKDAAVRTHTAFLTASFALERYKIEKGAYPETLDELVTGGYLSALPADPFNREKPLVYRRTSEAQIGYVLYSIGPDRKDDGGKAIDNSRRDRTQRWTEQERLRPQTDSIGDIVPRVNIPAVRK